MEVTTRSRARLEQRGRRADRPGMHSWLMSPPWRKATISAKVTGKVVEVLVEEGLRVKAGQVLARLDDSNVKTSLDVAESQLDSARTQPR